MVRANNLDFSYGKKPLFNSLDIQLERGHIYGLLGINGAGKTTLLKILTGQIFRHGGDLQVLGFDPRKRQPSLLQEIYYLPEEFSLPPWKTELYLKLNVPLYPRFDKESFYQYAESFGLDMGQKISRYSFGQKKKFLLAFGLATQSCLLVMDEPSNGLDIPSKRQFRKLLASALTPYRSFIISTHQVRELESLFDGIILLHQGQIVLNKTLDELARVFTFSLEEEEPLPSPDLIHAEKVPGGYGTVRRRKNHETESSLNMELLFNAVLSKPHLAANIFSTGGGK